MENGHDWLSPLLEMMPVKGTVDYRCSLAEPARRSWGWSASSVPNPPPKIWAARRHSTGLLSGRRL
jgi:hypothetical protein